MCKWNWFSFKAPSYRAFLNLYFNALIGTLKIHFELKPTLKTFNISIGKQYFFSIYLLENYLSSLVNVMQVLTETQIRNAP